MGVASTGKQAPANLVVMALFPIHVLNPPPAAQCALHAAFVAGVVVLAHLVGMAVVHAERLE